MPKSLPPKPNMDYLRKEAKDLLEARRRGDRSVLPVMRHLRKFRDSSDDTLMAPATSFPLSDAQLALAIDYGFEDWAGLKARVENTPPATAGIPRFSDIEELTRLSDRSLQLMMRDLDNADIAHVAAAGSAHLRERLFANVTERHRKRLESWSPADDANKIRYSQDRMLEVANKLAEMGELAFEEAGMPGRDAQYRSARERFVARAGAKPSSQRTNAELVAVLRAMAEVSRADGLLALDAVAAEFLDEELLRQGTEMLVDEMDVEDIRKFMETRRDVLLEQHRRRLEIAIQGVMRIAHGEHPNIVEAACRIFVEGSSG